MKNATLRGWYQVHKWTSLICTLFLLLLCLTGLPLIFHHEIDHLLGHAVEPPPLSAGMEQQADVDAIVADAAARGEGDAVQFLSRDAEEPELLFVRLGETVDAAEASAFYTYDARTGDFLSAYPVNEGVMNVLFRLHYDLFAGLPGTLFLGFMGLLFVLALISGAVIYAPYMRKLPFATVRRRQSPRLKWLDLHNLLGIATLVWVLVVGATGVINTLAVPIFGQWQSTELAEMTAGRGSGPAPPVSELPVQQALAAARAAEPDRQLSFMAFPGNGFAGESHFVAFMQGNTAWSSRLVKPVLIDARTARVVDSRPLPAYVSAVLISQPLHFGDYGGLPLKLLWAVLDVIAIVVLGSGVYLWLKRRNTGFETWRAGRAAQVAGGES